MRPDLQIDPDAVERAARCATRIAEDLAAMGTPDDAAGRGDLRRIVCELDAFAAAARDAARAARDADRSAADRFGTVAP